MKQCENKNENQRRNRLKNFCIRTNKCDKDSSTQIVKTFTYYASKAKGDSLNIESPEIFVTKSFDTKKRVEKFNFVVKGFFYMTQERGVAKVSFKHTLDINIQWKSKIFSPKKSVVLTK